MKTKKTEKTEKTEKLEKTSIAIPPSLREDIEAWAERHEIQPSFNQAVIALVRRGLGTGA